MAGRKSVGPEFFCYFRPNGFASGRRSRQEEVKEYMDRDISKLHPVNRIMAYQSMLIGSSTLTGIVCKTKRRMGIPLP
jgi:hypothetical protein